MFQSNVGLFDNPNLSAVALAFAMKDVSHPAAGDMASLAFTTDCVDNDSLVSVNDLYTNYTSGTIEGGDIRIFVTGATRPVRLYVRTTTGKVVSEEATPA